MPTMVLPSLSASRGHEHPQSPSKFLTALRSGGRSCLLNVGDASKRAYLRRNNAALADILSAPDSVQQIRAIAAPRAETPFADAFMRTAVQALRSIGEAFGGAR